MYRASTLFENFHRHKMDPKDIIGSDPLSWWFPYIVAIIVGVITCIREYIGGQLCPSRNNVTGKIILITGATGGLAFEVIKELVKRGGSIILTCKNLEDGNAKKETFLRIVPNAQIEVKQLDISSMASVKKFIANDLTQYRKIDILINNAAIRAYPFQMSEENFELHLATNYLGHFLLTHLLIPRLKAAGKSRIINITDPVQNTAPLFLNDLNITTNWNSEKCYAQSKLCLVLMAKHMARLLQGTHITINAVSPGIMRGTGLDRHLPQNNALIKLWTFPYKWVFTKTAIQGSQSIIYAAVDVNLDKVSGRFISNCELQNNCKKAQGKKLCEELYEKTYDMLGLPIKKL